MAVSRYSCTWASALDQAAHELGGQLGVLLGELDADRLAVHDGQGMAQLVAHVSVVADLLHLADEGRERLVLVVIDDGPVGGTLELAAEVREDLQRARFGHRGADALRALVRQQRQVDAGLQLRRVHLL